MSVDRNVLGGPLEACGTDPVTGFYRDGCCTSGPEDVGSHTICAVVTREFLSHQTSVGNDLETPRPEWGFPGLSPGDRWCVVAVRWMQAHLDGVAPPVVLASTHVRALEAVPLDVLQMYAADVPADLSEAGMTTPLQWAPNITTRPSVYSARDTVGRLQRKAERRGLAVFAVIDHQANARNVGLQMRASYVVIFGSPTAGTPLMLAAPLVALDLPLRVLVWEDEAAAVWASYLDPDALVGRYGLPAQLADNIRGIEALVAGAVSPEPQ